MYSYHHHVYTLYFKLYLKSYIYIYVGARKPMENLPSIYRKLVHNFVMGYAKVAGGLTCKELMLEDAPLLADTLLFRLASKEEAFKHTVNRFHCWAISCLTDDVPVGCASAALDPLHVNPQRLTKKIQKDTFKIHSLAYSQSSKQRLLRVFKVIQEMQGQQEDDIKLHQKRPSSDSESKETYQMDSTNQLEYHPRMLNLLNESTTDWNIIYFDFEICNPIFRQMVHPLAIGKKMFGLLPNKVQMLGDKAGEFLVKMLLNDFLDSLDSLDENR